MVLYCHVLGRISGSVNEGVLSLSVSQHDPLEKSVLTYVFSIVLEVLFPREEIFPPRDNKSSPYHKTG